MTTLAFPFGPVLVEKNGEPFLILHAEPNDTFAKADLPDNERWITLHPHKNSGESHGGIHIKIKVAPDGSAHVISGPGELRGLRLTRLASPEVLAERAEQRKEAKKEEKKKKKEEGKKKDQADLESAAADPEEAQRLAQSKLDQQAADKARTEKLSALDEQMKDLHERLLEHAATVTGDESYQSDRAKASYDPKAHGEYKAALRQKAADAGLEALKKGDIDADAHMESPGAGSVIASRNVRQISGALKALRRHVITSLVKDSDLRDAVLGEDGELDASEVTPKPSGGPGYAQDTTGQAKAQGFTKQDAKGEANEVFKNRMGEIRSNGEDERADAIEEMREKTINRNAAVRGIRAEVPDETSLNTPAPVREVSAHAIKTHAEDVRQFLSLHDELQALEKVRRNVFMGRDPDSTEAEKKALDDWDKPMGAGAEVDASIQDQEAKTGEALKHEIQDAAKADLTRAFLDAVHQGDDPGEGDKSSGTVRRIMQAHIGAGAHGQLANAALAATGSEGIDRQVVDALGTDAAAQLTAYAIHRDNPDAESVKAGLARQHDETSLPRMQSAIDQAELARADASGMEIPNISSSTDAAVIRDLNKQRTQVIAQAHEALGSALGAVEAGAALNLAMGRKNRKQITVRFGSAATAGVAIQLRALGLQDDDYELRRDPDDATLSATILQSGMDRLTPKQSIERTKMQQEIGQIKSGHEDEEDYLPAGFMRRASSDLVDSPDVPESFQTPIDFSQGGAQAVATKAAQLYADGYQPSEILRHLLDTSAQNVPEDQRGNFSRTVAAMIPFTREVEKTAKDGSKYTVTEATDIDHDPTTHADLNSLAERVSDSDHPQFHAQQTGTDDQTREALFRSIAQRPALQAAFSPPGDLGGTPEGRARVHAIKNYFLAHISKKMGGMKRQEYDGHQEAQQKALISGLGDCPEKWGGTQTDLFGGSNADGNVVLHLNPHATPEQQTDALRKYGLSQEHYTRSGNAVTVSEAGKDRLTVPQQIPRLEGESSDPVLAGGLDDLNPEWVNWHRSVRSAHARFPTSADLWHDYADHLGGTRRAFESVQEVMQHDLVSRFTDHHAKLTGQQLRVSKKTTQHWEKRLTATDPDEAQRIRARDRSIMDEVRGRDGTGRYRQMGEGGLAGAVQEHVERVSRQSMLQGGLGFDLGSTKEGGEVQGVNVHDLDAGAHERATLGTAAEGRISHMLNGSRWGIKPGDSPNKLMPDLTWGAGTKHVTKQRAVKMLLKSGRLIGWLGAGCVHRDTQLTDAETGETRTFHEWMVAGIAPKVFALTPDRRVIVAQATAPFIKDHDMMYRVTTASGRTVTVSGGHQFLTPSGWTRLDALKVGHGIAAPASPLQPLSAPALPASTSAPALEVSAPGAQDSTRTLPDSQARCSADSRPYGAPLQPESGSAPEPVPSRGGVPAHTLLSSHTDGECCESGCTPTCQCADRRASSDCLPQSAHLEVGASDPVSSIPSARSLPMWTAPAPCEAQTSPARAGSAALLPALPAPSDAQPYSSIEGHAHAPSETPNSPRRSASQPLSRSGHTPETASALSQPTQGNMRQARQEDSLVWDLIASIEATEEDFVYDISVPGPATYYAHGLWHHNSGKTGTMLGAFTQAHADGNARKALYVVPSIVRNQFGEAAAKMTTPGQYTWHAEDGDYATRKSHYSGDTHMVVVTHQTFRDDMLRLLGEHQGVSSAQAQGRFERMDRPARAAMFKAAMEHHGIPTDMLHVDEAHDFLNRAGKEDSTMSKVLEAALDNHKYKALWTGSPVKNDASEVHDWLAKVDPTRFSDRADFLRRYGVNTKASSEALQRLVDSYSMIDSVKPDIQRSVTWGMKGPDGTDHPIPLTREQQGAYEGVHAAYERASAANRRGQVDVDAAKILSPRSFEGLPEEEHHAAAARVQSALGTTKYSGLGRAVNEHDAESNAKVQHVLKLASERRGKGGVVFAWNRASISMLKAELEKAGHKVGVIDGSTTTDEKGNVRKAFDNGQHDIVLCSDAGATGANLQHRGEYLINYDLPLTQKTLEQRNARIDRLGQGRAIELHHLVTDTAYDRDNVKRLQTKKDLGSILQGEYRDMEDTGLASYIRQAQAERKGDAPPSWEEPLGASIQESPRSPDQEADHLYAQHGGYFSKVADDVMKKHGPTKQGLDLYDRVGKRFAADPEWASYAPDIIAQHRTGLAHAHERHNEAIRALGADTMSGRHVYGSFERPLDPTWARDVTEKGELKHNADRSNNRHTAFSAAHSYLTTARPLDPDAAKGHGLTEVHRPEYPLPATEHTDVPPHLLNPQGGGRGMSA